MAPSGKFSNHLLKSLSDEDLKHVVPHLQLVTIPLRQVLCEADASADYVYFPENSLLSIITTMSDGDMVEVGMTGPEGMAGMAALLGSGISAHQILVQAQGNVFRIEAARCKSLFDKHLNFRNVLLRYFEVFLNLASQTAACNRLHSIEQRCARWLLMATDRMQLETIPMTHEFLAAMLGARRAGVTEIAGEMQRLGLIRYHHGQLTIVDRKGLEKTACECYRTSHMRFFCTT